MGDGRKTRFWLDKWLGNSTLKDIFPRLFIVSLQREEFIANMGFWDGYHWHWNLSWRRDLFQWEVPLLEELIECLKEVNLAQNRKDQPWWKYDNKGIYSVKSFTKVIWDQSPPVENVRRTWLGLAPPKAELLIWLVLQQRLDTKSRLKRLNIIQSSDVLCPFCSNDEETIDHLFLHCSHVWRIWTECLEWCKLKMPLT